MCVTTVILAPGACGREVRTCSRCHRFRQIRRIQRIRRIRRIACKITGGVILNNALTLLATFAISNSDFEQHSHTFGHFCFEVFARSIKSCPCAAGSPPGPILALEIARQSAQDAPRCGQDGTRSHLLFSFSLSFSFFFFFSLSLSLSFSIYPQTPDQPQSGRYLN